MIKKQTAILLILVSILGSSLLTLLATDSLSFAGAGSPVSGLLRSSEQGPSSDQLDKVKTAMELVKQNYYQDVDTDKLVDGAIQGMMNALNDPFSSYMGKQTAKQFTEQIQGSFTGIGAEVSMENGNVVVVSPIKGSPAEKAGIRAKDILLSVNGQSFEGLTLNEAVAKIRGPKGTVAKVKVKREGSPNPLEFSINRDDIALETVNARMEQGGIGYIEITEFSENTAERFASELAKLESQGMKGLVLDVRNNPGGVLGTVEEMAQRFVPKGKLIVQVEYKSGERKKTVSTGPSSVKPYPVVLLTNKGSASASEILAGALKESAGAKLIGENTYGKGTVQQSYNRPFGDGSLLKITMAKWLTPDGEWIHKKGIKPDVAVAQPDYFSVAPINKEKTLKFDDNNDDVKSAQTMLNGLGYKPGRRDGYFDAGTRDAVRKFQEDQNLPVSGDIDAKTADAMEENLVKKIADPQNDAQLNRAFEEVRQEIAGASSKR
ncbi:peptidase S41 [Paenibacillus sp. CAA11]|uniref:S41 family peptidase n=1 Tax=Paenibacillus sp. CAA11 TaxID=1532905 RepID=UPI000D389A0E|nr:S41 family peptidase [Paenibacillus sp. CAA11]AWB46197.1 peptidase S41 [Paenibacillus sp. CAA11]